MSENSKIQWTDDTWNPWIGCVKVSPGCAHCYAEHSTPTRVARSKGVELWGGTNRQRASKATFDAPLRWNEKPWVCNGCGTPRSLGHIERTEDGRVRDFCDKCGDSFSTFHRRRVFSLSLGDIWDKDVPIEWLTNALDVIRRCPNLDFLLLTKRPELWPERIEAVLKWIESQPGWGDGEKLWPMCDLRNWLADWFVLRKAPSNVWLGTTVENQEMADKRIPELLKIPAKVRFLSVEPMLGLIRFRQFLPCDAKAPIDWVIVGGESGPNARRFDIWWARSTLNQCADAKVPCFVKQLGSNPVYEDWQTKLFRDLKLRDKKGGEISEWPDDLRIREFPLAKP